MPGGAPSPIERFKARYPDRPVVLQLSGTDIYEYLKSDPGSDAALDGRWRIGWWR